MIFKLSLDCELECDWGPHSSEMEEPLGALPPEGMVSKLLLKPVLDLIESPDGKQASFVYCQSNSALMGRPSISPNCKSYFWLRKEPHTDMTWTVRDPCSLCPVVLSPLKAGSPQVLHAEGWGGLVRKSRKAHHWLRNSASHTRSHTAVMTSMHEIVLVYSLAARRTGMDKIVDTRDRPGGNFQ